MKSKAALPRQQVMPLTQFYARILFSKNSFVKVTTFVRYYMNTKKTFES